MELWKCKIMLNLEVNLKFKLIFCCPLWNKNASIEKKSVPFKLDTARSKCISLKLEAIDVFFFMDLQRWNCMGKQ